MAALALSGSSDTNLARLMAADILTALHPYLSEALSNSVVEPINSDLRETVSAVLAVAQRLPPQINRISASRIGLLVAALQNSKKVTKSLLVTDACVVAAATSVRDAWTKANADQKASGVLALGDLLPPGGGGGAKGTANGQVVLSATHPPPRVVAQLPPSPIAAALPLPPAAPSFDAWSLSDIHDLQPKAKKSTSEAEAAPEGGHGDKRLKSSGGKKRDRSETSSSLKPSKSSKSSLSATAYTGELNTPARARKVSGGKVCAGGPQGEGGGGGRRRSPFLPLFLCQKKGPHSEKGGGKSIGRVFLPPLQMPRRQQMYLQSARARQMRT